MESQYHSRAYADWGLKEKLKKKTQALTVFSGLSGYRRSLHRHDIVFGFERTLVSNRRRWMILHWCLLIFYRGPSAMLNPQNKNNRQAQSWATRNIQGYSDVNNTYHGSQRWWFWLCYRGSIIRYITKIIMFNLVTIWPMHWSQGEGGRWRMQPREKKIPPDLHRRLCMDMGRL